MDKMEEYHRLECRLKAESEKLEVSDSDPIEVNDTKICARSGRNMLWKSMKYSEIDYIFFIFCTDIFGQTL